MTGFLPSLLTQHYLFAAGDAPASMAAAAGDSRGLDDGAAPQADTATQAEVSVSAAALQSLTIAAEGAVPQLPAVPGGASAKPAAAVAAGTAAMGAAANVQQVRKPITRVRPRETRLCRHTTAHSTNISTRSANSSSLQ